MTTLRDNLLDVVRAWCRGSGLSAARLSTLVLNRGGAITRVQAGGDFGTRQAERLMAYCEAHWPDGEPWPEHVLRPSVVRGIRDHGLGTLVEAAVAAHVPACSPSDGESQ